ncbi:MAG: hypothetical protein NXI00_11035 [Cytophagales bacterium]|nr:hypothetical protein [Cytophagales bacterium]
MAVQSFNSSGEILAISQTKPQSLIYSTFYSKVPIPVIGTVLYSNQSLTTKVNPLPWYGLVVSGQLYEVLLNSNSEIAVMNLVNQVVNPSPDANHINPAKDVTYNSAGVQNSLRSEWLITESGGQILLNDSNWATGFDSGATRRVFIGAEEKAVATARTLANLDITALQGMDIAPLTIYEGQKYSQTYIHIKANASKNRRKWQNGNKTYFWMPESHQFDNSLYPGFYKYFPDFTLPTGKIASLQLRWEDDYPAHRADNKGFTSTPSKPYAQSDYVDYDGWMLNNGIPPAYQGSNAARQAAWDNIPESTLMNAFLQTVVNPHKGRAFVELNFEPAVGIDLNGQKMINVLQQWSNANPSALLGFWANGFGAINCNRIQMQAEADDSRMTPDLQFAGTYNDWLNTRNGVSLFKGAYYIYHAVATVFYCNDLYQSRPEDYGWLHQAMMMVVMNRKFYPNKKNIFIDFHAIEYQITGPVDFVEVKHPVSGAIVKYPSKPLTSPGQRFTRALFGIAYADGIRLWNAPAEEHDDPYYYGYAHGQLDQNGNLFTQPRTKNYGDGRLPGRYFTEARSQKGVDWHVAAMWAISENKDIINANTSWEFLDFSTDGGSTYVSGTNKLLSKTFINKQPVVIFKPDNNGNVGLVLFFNPWQDATIEASYKIKINGVVHDIIQVGDYASCVRVII